MRSEAGIAISAPHPPFNQLGSINETLAVIAELSKPCVLWGTDAMPATDAFFYIARTAKLGYTQ